MEVLHISNRYYKIEINKSSTDETTNFQVDVNDDLINEYIFLGEAVDKVLEIASNYTERLLDEIKRARGRIKFKSVNDILLATSYNAKQVLQINENHINPTSIKYATKHKFYLYYCELFDTPAFYLVNLHILQALDRAAGDGYDVIDEADVVIV
jgi:hypothetical protein